MRLCLHASSCCFCQPQFSHSKIYGRGISSGSNPSLMPSECLWDSTTPVSLQELPWGRKHPGYPQKCSTLSERGPRKTRKAACWIIGPYVGCLGEFWNVPGTSLGSRLIDYLVRWDTSATIRSESASKSQSPRVSLRGATYSAVVRQRSFESSRAWKVSRRPGR